MCHTRFGFLVVLSLVLLGTPAVPASAEEMDGKISALFSEQRVFVLSAQDGIEYKIQADEHTKIWVNDQKSSFSDLQEGDEVLVTWEEMEDVEVNVATLIACKRRR